MVDVVKFAEPKFAEGKGPEAFDICVQVHNANDPSETDWVRLEWSENYGKGNLSTVKQKDLVLRTLKALEFEAEDLSSLPEFLEGKTIDGFAKESKPNKEGKVYVNLYLGRGGGGNEPESDKIIGKDEILKRIGKAFGSKAEQAPAAESNPTTTTTNKSPFGPRK